MSYKRPRSNFEEVNHAPYAVFGTPLPDEAESRDDGSYLPLWKQEARDERGRKRLHGAFTGGWSAGYFNTVGSKEGWTPSTFVSSRANRHHKDGHASTQQRAQDYMDEEDLADAAQAQQLQTSDAFAGLGSSAQQEARAGGLMGLFRPEGSTMGLQLLRRMGWKDGQGIGPKVRRGARLDSGRESAGESYLFAPDNAAMIQFVRKTDRKGLGHQGEARLRGLGRGRDADADDDDEKEQEVDRGAPSIGFTSQRGKPKSARGAFGVGVLNDTGSDEEDPYDIGLKIKYNRVMGGDDKKKKQKATSAVANPALVMAPKFRPKTARVGNGLRRCHDGRLALDGFVLAKVTEDPAALLSRYAPPAIPSGWKSARDPMTMADVSQYVSSADAAKASSHDPRSRAIMLGEKALPGKSVFDYLSSSTRDKLAAVSGRKDLPPARGEVVTECATSGGERKRTWWEQVPKLERDAAAAALSRGLGGGPYADDEPKRARYRRYLEHQSNPGLPPPEKAEGMTDEGFLREMKEFYDCARIFKPMTGFMASRFTTSKTVLNPSGGSGTAGADLMSDPEPKAADPAEEAARMGMFGHMTRSAHDFFPTRLLCKRFNVKAPAHSRPDHEPETSANRGPAEVPSATAPGEAKSALEGPASAQQAGAGAVDPDRNEAVEETAANADVLRAIFGDSDGE